MGIDQSYYDQEMASEHILDVESGYSRYDRGVTNEVYDLRRQSTTTLS